MSMPAARRCEYHRRYRAETWSAVRERCPADATHEVRAGCVHEHLLTAKVCQQHTTGVRSCAPCAVSSQPHQCLVQLIDCTPLPLVGVGE